MKRFLILVLLIAVQIFAQKVTVIENAAVTNTKDGAFYYPAVSPDGANLLFSSESYKGLWSKNLSTGKTVKITDANGAGYEPAFSAVSGEVLFREDKFVKGKRFSSLLSYDAVTKKSVVLEDGVRDLKLNRDNSNAFKNYVRDTEVRTTMKQNMLQKSSAPEKVVFIQDSKIVLSENGSQKVLQPLGEGNYIWASLSPDKTKLLFTYAGRGTYVTNLEGKVLNKIGYANYPSWSPDGNWVLFMKDLDNGVNTISSEIYIANLLTGKYFNITSQRDEISLYPKWGTTNADVYYNTDNGQIRKIKLKYE
jgi:Tol biopolymer transport system component